MVARDPSRAAHPSRIRWRIVGLLFVISVITYIDRVNISVTARQMMPALGLTDLQMGHIFSAFVVGYAVCQVPGGWLGDRFGPRRVLAFAVCWWSIFTALTAIAPTLPLVSTVGSVGSLVFVRFLVGAGEAAALPTFNRTVANWLPPQERGFGIALAISGIGLGSAVTPPVTAWIMANYGWQSPFYLAALLGLLIAVVWGLYATDRPTEHRHVNAQELSIIQAPGDSAPPASEAWSAESGPHRSPAGVPGMTIWWLVLSYSCLGYVAYVYMSWFYLYLVNVRGLSVLRGGLFAALPFLAIALFCPLGGWVTDYAAAQWGRRRGRQYVGIAGMALASLSISIGAAVEAPLVAIMLLSLGAGWLYFTVGAYWTCATDLSPRHAGVLSGLMNTGANIGGAVSPTLTPWLAQHFGWSAALSVAAATALVGGLLWFKIDPGEQ